MIAEMKSKQLGSFFFYLTNVDLNGSWQEEVERSEILNLYQLQNFLGISKVLLFIMSESLLISRLTDHKHAGVDHL